jgi:predicted aconitase
MRLFAAAMAALFAVGMFSVGSTASARSVQVPVRTSVQDPYGTHAITVAKKKKKAHHPSALTVKQAGRAFLADVAPVNSAINAFAADASIWSSSTTDAQAESDAAPVMSALQTLQTKLETTKWPGAAKQDVHALILAVSPLQAALQNLATLNFLDVGSWEQSFTTAADGIKTADALVRVDFRLPSAS